MIRSAGLWHFADYTIGLGCRILRRELGLSSFVYWRSAAQTRSRRSGMDSRALPRSEVIWGSILCEFFSPNLFMSGLSMPNCEVRLDSDAASGAGMAPPRVPIRAGHTRPLGVALGPEGPHTFLTINHRTTANPSPEPGPRLPHAPSIPSGATGPISAGSRCPGFHGYCGRSAAPRAAPLAPDGGAGSPLGARVAYCARHVRPGTRSSGKIPADRGFDLPTSGQVVGVVLSNEEVRRGWLPRSKS